MRNPARARTPRTVTVTFLAVAVVSTGLLGGLAWLLVEQDRQLEQTRAHERQAQAADRFAAEVQPALAGPAAVGAVPALPPWTTVVSISDFGVSADAGALLYYPHISAERRDAPADLFAAGERFEHATGDHVAAERAYANLANAADAAVRAGALGRLARVQRKRLDIDAALATYDRLAAIDEPVSVEGFPATLFSRLGRASALQEANRLDGLHAEARGLWQDLSNGRWVVSLSEYEARRREVHQWLGEPPVDDPDRVAVARAVEWLWQNRRALVSPGHRPLQVQDASVLVAWTPAGDRLRAGVAGPASVEALVNDVRTEAASRRTALAAALGATALVLLAGWYFILRAVSRERRAAELQSDFVAAVSHEFRSPLTSMAHLAEMLEADRVPSGEPTRTSYRALVRDTHRLRRLVEDLLDFRRFEMGAGTLRLEPLDLTDLVRTAIAEFEARVVPAGYRIELEVPAGPIRVAADREALTRALSNLIDNAIKYSPASRIVRVELTREAERVAIAVQDHGLGIPADEQRRIFDRFVRGREARALRIKGTGIGLAIVRHIVRAHGGDVRVASEPGHGSTFTIDVPAATPRSPERSEGAERRERRGWGPAALKRRSPERSEEPERREGLGVGPAGTPRGPERERGRRSAVAAGGGAPAALKK